jgi:hypothetical protein
MKRNIICNVVSIVFLIYSASFVMASCPEGKSEVNIDNKGGQHKIICVSGNAVQGIAAASDHSDTISVPLQDVSGYWNFYITKEGTIFEEAPQHMTISQEGGSVTVTATCDEEFPLITGTIDGTSIYLTYDLGSGSGNTISGETDFNTMTGSFTSPYGEGTFRALRTVDLDCSAECDPVTVPRFVNVDYVNLSLIEEISKFRSGFGHDYSDFCESCRSMKNYYYFYDEYRIGNGIIEIYSPVDGIIVEIADEQYGASSGLINREVFIQSSLYSHMFFILSHVDLISSDISVGKHVTGGELMGHARIYYPELDELARGNEIGVLLHTPYGSRYVPYFETMDDSLFSTYVARGVATRSDFLISKEERDADPLTCVDEDFVHEGSIENWVLLD